MPRVLLIECKDKNDPGSEALFLTHLFQMLDISYITAQANLRRSVIEILSSIPKSVKIVHLSTHGRIDKKIIGFTTTKGSDLTLDDLEETDIDLSGKTLITTACQAGINSFGHKFIELTNCDYYIGSSKDVYHRDSIYFSHLFYHHYLCLKKNVKESFKSAKEICGADSAWRIMPLPNGIRSA